MVLLIGKSNTVMEAWRLKKMNKLLMALVALLLCAPPQAKKEKEGVVYDYSICY